LSGNNLWRKNPCNPVLLIATSAIKRIECELKSVSPLLYEAMALVVDRVCGVAIS
jgi:hypothetical protein